MRNRWMLFTLALLGVFGASRLGEAEGSSAAPAGLPSTQKELPPIDATVAAKAETATFALG